MKSDILERETELRDRVLVLGFGNILQRDDGVGVHALRWLQKDPQFAGMAEFITGSTTDFSLLKIIEDANALIVLDAVMLDKEPGDVQIFEGMDMDRLLTRPLAATVDELNLSRVMEIARLGDRLPPQRALIGVQPEGVTWGDTLSPAVSAALPRVSAAVARTLEGWRHEA